MRLFEWLVVVAVIAIAWEWARGRRPGVRLGMLAAVLVAASIVVEGQRAAMWPAYVVAGIAALMAVRGVGATEGAVRGGGLRVVGRGLGALVVVLLGVGLPVVWPVIKLPKPSGPYPVGTVWLVVRDSARHERFSSVPGAVREFPVKVWYPAPAGTTGASAPYAEPAEMTALGLIPKLLTRQATLIKTHSIAGAPMVEGRAPVLIFSHGYTGYAAQNTPQMEELASRGYVVASIAHTGEASWTPFPDGHGVPIDSGVLNSMTRQMKQGIKAADQKRMFDSVSAALAVPDLALRQAGFRRFLDLSPEPLRSASVREWALDTKVLVDRLGALNAGAVPSPFKDRLDLEHLGVFGMSYGGATAGEFCRLDRRCRAAINIDGGQYGGLIDDSLTVPLLILASEQAYGVHLPVLDLTRGPAYLAAVPATNHIGLTDLSLQGPLFRWAGITGKLDPDRREDIMTSFVVGFFEKYLMGRSPELFDGLPARFPEVKITKRNVP